MKMRKADRPHLYPDAMGYGWCCRIPFAGLNYFGSGLSATAAYLAASSNVFRAMSRIHTENDAAVARSREPGARQNWLQAFASGTLELRN